MMKNIANKTRKPVKDVTTENKIINSLCLFLGGILLGVLSKWLDNLSLNDAIWWQNMLGILDLRNVFSDLPIWIFIAVTIAVFSSKPQRASLNVLLFFIGMTVTYHLYTICFSGFNPWQYMLIWYALTLISPVLAYICWYAKGEDIVALVISCTILAVMFKLSFGIGIWYFYAKSIPDSIIFVETIIALYVKPKNTICSLIGALILAFMISSLIYL